MAFFATLVTLNAGFQTDRTVMVTAPTIRASGNLVITLSFSAGFFYSTFHRAGFFHSTFPVASRPALFLLCFSHIGGVFFFFLIPA
ncbi:hypothetical protein V1505DRAFT_382152 [Lipomyces doorenjongii]